MTTENATDAQIGQVNAQAAQTMATHHADTDHANTNKDEQAAPLDPTNPDATPPEHVILVIAPAHAPLLSLLAPLESTGQFKWVVVTDCDAALAALEQHHERFQAIVLGFTQADAVNHTSAYQFCAQIHEHTIYQHLPFIIIADEATLDNKIQGYTSGATEFLTQPLEVEELAHKLSNIIHTKLDNHRLNQQLSDSYNTTMQAMTYSSYLGRILLFIQEASNIKGFDELAKLVRETTEALGLHSAIQFYRNKAVIKYKDKSYITPLESDILELTRYQCRFYDFGTRTAIHYTDFSLLIRNMPIDDPDKYGVIKDVLGNLCNAIEVIAKSLLTHEVVTHKSQTMLGVAEHLKQMQASLHTIQTKTEAAISNMIDDTNEAIMTLGLTEGQETIIRTITANCLAQADLAFEDGKQLIESFSQVHSTLKATP